MDKILDEEIQTHTARELEQAEQAADQASTYVLRMSSTLIPVSLLCSVGSALMILMMLRTIRKHVFELETLTVELRAEVSQRKRTEQALQALSRRLVEAQENERHRLARELHDQIGQSLTAIKINLEAMQRSTAANGMDRLRDSISIVGHTLQQVRTLSLDLRPPVLDDLGPVAVLRWHMDQHGQRSGFTTQLIADVTTTRWPPEIEITAFRVVQEALTNIARHARAKHVRVELRQRNEAMHLTIRDGGVGFNANAARLETTHGASIGLLGMQERVSLAGGTLDLQSVPSGGTQIEVCLPLQDKST
jgi:signal transduction histidine kinase